MATMYVTRNAHMWGMIREFELSELKQIGDACFLHNKAKRPFVLGHDIFKTREEAVAVAEIRLQEILEFYKKQIPFWEALKF